MTGIHLLRMVIRKEKLLFPGGHESTTDIFYTVRDIAGSDLADEGFRAAGLNLKSRKLALLV